MLYGRHLGYKGNFEKNLAERDSKALELFQKMNALQQEALGFMKVKAIWQFFEAERQGNDIHLFAPSTASPGGPPCRLGSRRSGARGPCRGCS